MADYSNLGVFGGYYAQQQAQTETNLLKSLAPIEVAQAGAKLQETQIEVQQKNFDLRNAESLYARQQKMLAQMDAKSNSGATGDLAGQVNSEAEHQSKIMFQQADLERANGFYKEANETAQKASAILENNSKIQTRQFNIQEKQFNSFQDILGSIHSERDWDAMRAQFPMLHPDAAKMPGVQQILQMKYPGQAGVDAMSSSLKLQKEKAQTAAALADATARTATAAKDEAYTRDYLPKLETLADARAAHLEKAGGNAQKVTPSDVSSAQKMIEAKYPNADPNQAYVLARHLAQDAAVLQARGMSKADAQDQAMRNAGPTFFAGIRRSRDMPGATPTTPLSLPESADPSKMKDGMYYMTPKHGLRVWDQKSGQLLAPDPEAIRAQDEDQPQDVPVGDEGESDE